jgi:hypothetical protein
MSEERVTTNASKSVRYSVDRLEGGRKEGTRRRCEERKE